MYKGDRLRCSVRYFFLWQVVAGGGAVEAALSVYLENLATTLGSREQLAIAEFAEALLVIPKVSPFFFFFPYNSDGILLGERQ